MNVKVKANVKANIEGCGPVCEKRERSKIARISSRAGDGDHRTDQGGRGRFYCGFVPEAIREERSASTSGSLFINHILPTTGGVCQSITYVEAAEFERNAASRTGVSTKPGCADSVEEGTGLHLSVWKGSALLPLWATKCKRGRSNGECTPPV